MAEKKKKPAKKKPTTKAVVVVEPEEILDRDECINLLLKTAHTTPCASVEALSELSGVPVPLVNEIATSLKVDFVKLSNFRDTFAPSLAINIRNLLLMITEMTQTGTVAGCDPFKIQKYVSTLNTLNNMLREIEGKTTKVDGLARRTVRVSEIIEEFYRDRDEIPVN